MTKLQRIQKVLVANRGEIAIRGIPSLFGTWIKNSCNLF